MPAPERRVSGVPPLHKLRQIWRLVRESHQHPITGQPQPPKLVTPGRTGITFIGHSSFLLQTGGRNLLIDPVFSKRLILLRRQRQPGLRIEDLPHIDAVLVTHAHMDHLDLASLRAIAPPPAHGTASPSSSPPAWTTSSASYASPPSTPSAGGTSSSWPA